MGLYVHYFVFIKHISLYSKIIVLIWQGKRRRHWSQLQSMYLITIFYTEIWQEKLIFCVFFHERRKKSKLFPGIIHRYFFSNLCTLSYKFVFLTWKKNDKRIWQIFSNQRGKYFSWFLISDQRAKYDTMGKIDSKTGKFLS